MTVSARRVFLATALVLAGCVGPAQRREPEPQTPASGPVTRPADAPASPPQRKYHSEVAYPRNAEEVSGPAVMSLIDQARAAQAAGHPDQSVALLETALQIERRNPFVWSALAQAHLANRDPEDAEIVAHRSNSFANGNPYVETGNWRVIAKAREQRGDAAGVKAAQDRLAQLEALLDN